MALRGIALALLCLFAPATALGDVDVSQPLLCAMTGAVECDHESVCSSGSVEELNLPPFIWIDKETRSLREHQGTRSSVAETVMDRDGYLVLQGYENRAYSISISQKTGKLSATAAAEGVGFLLFGVCTNL